MEGVPNIENLSENLNKGQIEKALENFLEGAEYKVTRVLESVDGIYLYEISLPDTDPNAAAGSTVEYTYTLAGEHEGRRPTLSTSIEKAYYDSDGMPIGGDRVAQYVDNQWEIL